MWYFSFTNYNGISGIRIIEYLDGEQTIHNNWILKKTENLPECNFSETV